MFRFKNFLAATLRAPRRGGVRPETSYRLEDWKRGIHRFRKNPLSIFGLAVIVVLAVMALAADIISPYPEDAYGAVQFERRFQPPSPSYPFGTDEAGRDVLTRIIFGTRISLAAAVLIQAYVTVAATTLGLIAGYVGGRVSSIVMRTADIFMSIPPLLLALVAASAFQPDLGTVILAVSLAWWPWKTRVVYSVVLSLREEQFVEASRLIGRGRLSIMFKDVLPHVIPVVVVKATLDMGFVILFISSLSFLGIGVQEPTPDWGMMISLGRKYLPEFWWLSTFPGLFIFAAVMAFSLLGDGLRDLLDVQLEEEKAS